MDWQKHLVRSGDALTYYTFTNDVGSASVGSTVTDILGNYNGEITDNGGGGDSEYIKSWTRHFNALQLDNDDYVQLDSMSEINQATQFTWAVSIKSNQETDTRYIFNKSYSTNLVAFYMNDKKIKWYTRNSGTLNRTETSYDLPNEWTRVCVVFDGTQATYTDRLKVYINGDPIDVSFIDDRMATELANIPLGDECYIGKDNGYSINSPITQYIMWTTALSAKEVHMDYMKNKRVVARMKYPRPRIPRL